MLRWRCRWQKGWAFRTRRVNHTSSNSTDLYILQRADHAMFSSVCTPAGHAGFAGSGPHGDDRRWRWCCQELWMPAETFNLSHTNEFTMLEQRFQENETCRMGQSLQNAGWEFSLLMLSKKVRKLVLPQCTSGKSLSSYKYVLLSRM